jgi:hypothetical protein
MRQSGKDRAFARLVKAYARATGRNIRTAQRHAASAHPDFQRYTQGQACDAVTRGDAPATPVQVAAATVLSPVRPPPPPSVVLKSDAHLSEPERVLKATYLMWDTHFEAWQQCLRGAIIAATENTPEVTIPADHGMAMAHAALCVKLRADYKKALQDHSQWEIETRRVIPINEFAGLSAEFVAPLGNLMGNMPAELAASVNPQNPTHAFKAMSDWLKDRAQPVISGFITRLEEYVAAPPAAA